MELAGISNFKNPALGTFIATEQIFCKITDEASYNAWLAEDPDRQEQFTKTEYRKSVLNKWAKERLAEGDDLPPGIEFVPAHIIQIRKPRNTGK